MYESHYLNYSGTNFSFIFCSGALSFQSVCGMIKVENTSLNFIGVMARSPGFTCTSRPEILYSTCGIYLTIGPGGYERRFNCWRGLPDDHDGISCS